jgi:cellulose synthase/poly-beta-1,6-N-acetylglucosamine synthase-like glycosyltransferase
MKPFFVVLARDSKHVTEKVRELENLGVSYLIVCGENLNLTHVVHRTPKGKYDAINFAARNLPKDAKVIAFNDVDTKIHNIEAALRDFKRTRASLLFAKLRVKKGPQVLLNALLDSMKRRILVTASGELMLIRREILDKILPLKPCKAEDTYILFKILEHGGKAVFCEKCYVETERTASARNEEEYKRKTVGGTYQALSHTKPPLRIRLFYFLLPFMSPLLLVLGRKGYYSMMGILLGFLDFIRGDNEGFWKPTYME